MLRRVCLALICAGLSACAGIGLSPSSDPVARLAISGGAVTAAGPAGYCVDQSTSRPRNGFATLAPCATLGGEGALPAITAVALVQVGAAGSASVSGSEPVFADFLSSEDGRALLSRAGDASQISVARATGARGVVTVGFADAAPPPIDGLQSEEWRSFIDVGDRLVTVSVRGLSAQPLSASTGELLLSRFVTALRDANSADGSIDS